MRQCGLGAFDDIQIHMNPASLTQLEYGSAGKFVGLLYYVLSDGLVEDTVGDGDGRST